MGFAESLEHVTRNEMPCRGSVLSKPLANAAGASAEPAPVILNVNVRFALSLRRAALRMR